MLTRPPDEKRAAARERQRRWRRRQRNGNCIFKLEANEHELAEASIEAGVLSPEEALSRAKLGEVAQGVLDAWQGHWRKS
jgi:hypothetical protein